MREVETLFEKAERSFAAADLLLDSGDADFAASRAYYGYFYVAQALLLSVELRFSRHGQVVAGYGRHFASTGRLDRRYHRFLIRAFELRQLADYSAEVDIDPEVVAELIEVGRHSSRQRGNISTLWKPHNTHRKQQGQEAKCRCCLSLCYRLTLPALSLHHNYKLWCCLRVTYTKNCG